MNKECSHEAFECLGDVSQSDDGVCRFAMAVSCIDCGTRFKFVSNRKGSSMTEPFVSADGFNLYAVIEPEVRLRSV